MFPPRVILSAVDFSDSSRTALLFAGRLARQTGAALHVLHAQEPLLAEGARHAGFDLVGDTEAELARFVADVSTAGSAGAPRLDVATGPAVDVIVRAAQRLDADIIVVGSHGMSGTERAFFGSTTEGVLRHSSASVLVTPAQWSPVRSTVPDLSGTGPVIAAVDFSTAASEAAKAACRLASVLSTTLTIVHVVSEPPVLARWRGHAEAAVRDRAEAARSEIEKLTTSIACDVPVEVRVEIGAVPSRLAHCADCSDAHRPILVLGRRAPGEKGGPPGSTAYRVLMLSKAPVLMYVAE